MQATREFKPSASPDLLQRAGMQEFELSLGLRQNYTEYLNRIVWLTGDVFGIIIKVSLSDDRGTLVSTRHLQIQQTTSSKITRIHLPEDAFAIFNWPEEPNCFATLHGDVIIIWDASDPDQIKKHKQFSHGVRYWKWQDEGGINQIGVFPGNRQLAVRTTNHALFLLDLEKETYEKFSDIHGEFASFCILDSNHLAIFSFIKKDKRDTDGHLKITIWNVNFDATYCWSWRKSTETIDIKWECSQVFLHGNGKFISTYLPDSRLLNLSLYKDSRTGKYKCSELSALKEATYCARGYTSDGLLIATSHNMTYAINPVTGEIIHLTNEQLVPAGPDYLLSGGFHPSAHKINDSMASLFEAALLTALPKFSADIVDIVYQYTRLPHVFFNTIKNKKALLPQQSIAFFKSFNETVAGLRKKDRRSAEEEKVYYQARQNKQIVRKFLNDIKKGFTPLEAMVELKCQNTYVGLPVQNFLSDYGSHDPLTLAHRSKLIP